MRLYAAALSARRTIYHPGRVELITEIVSVAFLAINNNEALGKALTNSYAQYPESDGWSNHQVSVVEIPTEMIQEITIPEAPDNSQT